MPIQKQESEQVVGTEPRDLDVADTPSCACPCPDGITVSFVVEWDAPGPFNPNLLTSTLDPKGQTENAPGESGGETVEIEGSTDVHVDFGNPKLGQAASGDIIINFAVKPFFKNGFDEERCYITATGAFDGKVHIESYTKRGTPTETVEIGDDDINETVGVGECEDPKKQCCERTYVWDYNESFGLKKETGCYSLSPARISEMILYLRSRRAPR